MTIPPQIRPDHRLKDALIYMRQSSPQQLIDHTGSTDAQRDLAALPEQWGWPRERIHTIESDLGVSGKSIRNRKGFQKLVDLIKENRVSLVIVGDVDRLGREPRDLFNFYHVATQAGVLLYFGDDTVFDTTSADDTNRLALYFKTIIAWYENALRLKKVSWGKLAKARQGKPVTPPPIGYVRSDEGAWRKDSDDEVGQRIVQAFELYLRLGSLNRVVNHFRQANLSFPRRRARKVIWGPVNAAHLYTVLRNPAYKGTYAFQRFKSITSDNGRRVVRRPESEWIPKEGKEGTHPEYVSAETWQRVQDMLSAHKPGIRPLLGKGAALLQGVLKCGHCNRWMHTRYWGSDGQVRTASYVCKSKDGWGAVTRSTALPARLVDHAVVRELMNALTPAGVEAALHVASESARGESELKRAQYLALRRLQEEKDQAYQLLLQGVGSQNPRVRIELESRLASVIERHDQVQAELTAVTRSEPKLNDRDVADLIERTKNFQALWNAPQRTNEDRKRLLRIAIPEVVVVANNDESIHLEIVWSNESRQPIVILRPRGVQQRIAEQTAQGRNAGAIAADLDAAGVITTRGKPISSNLVHQKQGQLGIRRKHGMLKAEKYTTDSVIANVPRYEIRRTLDRDFPQLGPWDAQRFSDVIRRLSAAGKLPAILPERIERENVIAMLRAGKEAGKTWPQLVQDVKAAGYRPPRGRNFTANQLQLLYRRAGGADQTVPARLSADR